jgi:hypothetical protein
MRRSWAIAAAVTVALAWAGAAFVAISPHGSSVKVPVLFTPHFRTADEATGALMGASSDLQAARIRQLVTEAGQPIEYVSLPATPHSLHGSDPQLYVDTVVGWVGALGGFLIGGVAKVVVLQHCTFLINSACHTIGRQPYSTRCSARDSLFLALFTFGEGYHNYHHEFQHDYRNGVKPWQWDPTKWLIWILSKLGLTGNLRRVPREAIESTQARVRDLRRQVES